MCSIHTCNGRASQLNLVSPHVPAPDSVASAGSSPMVVPLPSPPLAAQVISYKGIPILLHIISSCLPFAEGRGGSPGLLFCL